MLNLVIITYNIIFNKTYFFIGKKNKIIIKTKAKKIIRVLIVNKKEDLVKLKL